MQSPILAVSELCRSYRSGDRDLAVLVDVTFSVSAGEACAIIGPSGSGKSTLLGLCAGLDRQNSGSVRLCDQELEPLTEDERATLRSAQVGFVFQSFRLLPTLTALENVMVPLELAKADHIEDRARERLATVGLGERVGHYPTELSGGEQQRVALARAFVNAPRILFADEPTGNLDGETASDVTDLLFSLNKDAGTTLVLVTHDRALAERTGRVISLKRGRVSSDTGASDAGASDNGTSDSGSNAPAPAAANDGGAP